MFNLNSKLKRLTLEPSKVVAIIVSGNRPNVAVAGPEQEMDAYIVSTKEGKKRSIYICFHAVLEDKRIFYTSDKCPTTESKIQDVEMEAVKFVEQLGFMMVRQNILDEYSGDTKDDYIMIQAPFAENLRDIREREEKENEEKEASEENSKDDEYEYEEVEEEVYEEVPIDDEEDDSGQVESAGEVEEDQEMEYENLDDIIADDENDFKEKPSEKVERIVEDSGKSKDREGTEESKTVADSNEEYDLGDEISDAVEFLTENAPDAAISDKTSDGDKVKHQQQEEKLQQEKVKPQQQKVEPQQQEKKPQQEEAKSRESVYFVEESQKHLVKILIAL